MSLPWAHAVRGRYRAGIDGPLSLATTTISPTAQVRFNAHSLRLPLHVKLMCACVVVRVRVRDLTQAVEGVI